MKERNGGEGKERMIEVAERNKVGGKVAERIRCGGGGS